MMQAAERVDPPARPGAGFVFGAERMLALLDAFDREIPGVREGKDPEHLHRMRVASRRLRAALPLVLVGNKGDEHRAWVRQIKKITRALGAARDADVQIAFLKKYRKSLVPVVPALPVVSSLPTQPAAPDTPTLPGTTGDPGEPPAPTEDPVNALLTRLQKRRDPLQKEVFAALADLEKARVLEEMREFFLPFVPVRGKKRIRVSLCGIPPVAADRIGKCLVDVRQYESWVHNPDAAYEHHALRIATKKLRYTMEYYAPVYRRRFAKPLARIKRLQDLLGDIHDCDVWIDQVTIAIIKQRTHEHSPKERSFASVSSVAPLRRLLVNREKRRARLYRQFVRFWDQLVRTRFWDEVRQTILSGQKSVFLHRETGRKKEERESFSLLSSSVPGQEVHAGIVAHLAGRLFDELQSLHRLSPRDRDLLAYAALVHDIGWKYGDEGHQKKSAEMILSSGYLPVPLFEQAIIALAAGLHGGNTKVRLPGIYSLLPGADKARVRALGALLRVADGLDYTRAGRVTDLKCTIRESEVDCELMVSADAGAEMIRATKKSDLFSDVFKRPLVIL